MRHLILVLICSFGVFISHAQDTILFNNGDQMIGELKTLDKGVITFKTSYSDSDFKIEWKGVKRLSTATIFLITLSDGTRFKGAIAHGDSVSLMLKTMEGEKYVRSNEIVYLKSLDEGLWSQIYANVDIGLSVTKAKNLRQLNVTAGLGYLGENWSWDARYSSLNSTQDSIQPTIRNEGGVSANLFLPNDWFLTVATDFLSNTEQLLDLRTNARGGFGYYIVHKNNWYWSFAGGAAYINETYSNGENGKESMEGFISTELNLFDFGDFGLFTKISAYPGITERGRFRTDFKMDVKYDLPLDFYVKGGFTLNYDNQPTVGAGEVDYVLNTGFGWEW